MSVGRELLTFIEKSPTSYQAVASARELLSAQGFAALHEGEKWHLTPGGRYYVTRNQSSLLAFVLPEGEIRGFQIAAAHSDSPSFRVKPKMEWASDSHYVQINTEPYGGGIYATWLDRPLSVAGRVLVDIGEAVESRLVQVEQDLFVIPQVAIHMNRKVNDGAGYNAQKDMLPLFASGEGKSDFKALIAAAADTEPEKIAGMDLFLYNRTPGMLWGHGEEFVSAPRLDDLQCAFALLKGFLAAKPATLTVYALFDNEEVGSLSKQGADSTFLADTLRRICFDLGGTEEEYLRHLALSFLVSADNAHAVHPAHPEYADALNRVYMNEGIVIKYNANQKYTSDGLSGALFRKWCQRAGVSCQTYTNRSDMAGGSTLGNLNNRHVSLNAVDIGLAQLAMHSCYETAGVKDTEDLIRAMREFYSSGLAEAGQGNYRLL